LLQYIRIRKILKEHLNYISISFERCIGAIARRPGISPGIVWFSPAAACLRRVCVS
jgi:hypothetical protein